MTPEQLLKQIRINRELIISNNLHALEHLQMLKADYMHLANEEIMLSLELNNTLAEIYYHSNYSAALENSLRVVSTYASTLYVDLLSLHYKHIGFCYSHMGEFAAAEKSLLSALACTVPDNPAQLMIRSDIYHTLAMNHEMIEEGSPKSIEYLQYAMEGLDEVVHADKIANCQMGMGNVYNNMEKVERALEYYLQAVVTFEHSFKLSNMASAYSNIGNCYMKLGELDKAEMYLEKSLELRAKFASPDDLSISYYNLAIVYKERKQYERAKEYLLKARTILEQAGAKPYIAEVNDRLAELEMLAANAAVK